MTSSGASGGETLSHLKFKSRENRLGVVHQFSLYLNAHRPESRVMPSRLLPAFARNIRFYRIIFTEVGALMDAAGKLPPKIRAACIRFLIGLLYTTGLRISEAINLNLGDVDLEHNTLFVHRGKFGEDRLIALSPSTRNALDEWLHLRSFHAGTGNSAPFFTSYLANERGVSKNTITAYSDTLRLLIKHLCGKHGKQPEQLSMEMLNPEAVLDFLDHLFLNNKEQPITRFGIGRRVELHARNAAGKCPSLNDLKITPHVFRHTTALHLIETGSDITILKEWLGHADLKTAGQYVEVSVARKLCCDLPPQTATGGYSNACFTT